MRTSDRHSFGMDTEFPSALSSDCVTNVANDLPPSPAILLSFKLLLMKLNLLSCTVFFMGGVILGTGRA